MPMTTDLPIRCSCGEVKGVASGLSARTGNRLVCYCDDCQAFARHLGHPERILDAHGGTDIVQTSAGRVRVDQGADRLACVRLTPKGVLRWYATCCGSPIANTAATPSLPFAGLFRARLGDAGDGTPGDEVLGPIRGRVRLEYATGDAAALQADKGSLAMMIVRIAAMMIGARLRGDQKRTPFFGPGTGKPIATPHLLSDQERQAAYRAS